MILITGATGTIGKELVQDLLAQGMEFRAMVRGENTRADLEARGVQAVIGDFGRPETFAAALKGVQQVFLLTLPHPDCLKLEGAFLEAARKAGVRKIVRLSAIGASPSNPSSLLRCHGQCEAQLEASGIAWTLLRPTMFMQNLGRMYGDSVARTSTLFAPAGEARIPWVDCRDIAAAARAVLTHSGHEGLVYDLTGPELHTYESVAELLSRQLGRTVKYVDVPDDAAYDAMTGMGMSGWFASGMISIFHQFRANAGTAVVQGNLARITGRVERTLNDYLKEHLNAFRGTAKVSSPAHSS